MTKSLSAKTLDAYWTASQEPAGLMLISFFKIPGFAQLRRRTKGFCFPCALLLSTMAGYDYVSKNETVSIAGKIASQIYCENGVGNAADLIDSQVKTAQTEFR